MYATGYIGLPPWLRYSSQARISGNTRTWGFCLSSIRLLSLLSAQQGDTREHKSMLVSLNYIATRPCGALRRVVSLKSDRAKS